MYGYIYSITNKVNGKKYIGKTKNVVKREFDHFNDLKRQQHHSIKLQRAYNKYGKENFQFDWKKVQIDTEEDLAILEIKTIEKYNSYKDGYNCTQGGEGHKSVLNYSQSCAIAHLYEEYDAINHKLSRLLKCDPSVFASIKNNIELFPVKDEDKDFYNYLLQNLELKLENLKENYHVRFGKKITDEDGVRALCVIATFDRVEKSVAEYFNTNNKTFYNIRNGKTYKNVKAQFDELTPSEQKEIGQYYYKEWGIERIKNARLGKMNNYHKTPLTEEQIKEIIENKDNLTYTDLGRKYNRSSTTISDIAHGRSFKSLYQKYKK